MKHPARKLFVRALSFVAPYKGLVLGVTALALVLAVLGVADPLILKSLFDGLVRGDMHAATYALGALVLIEIGRALLGGWSSVLSWRARLGVDFTIRERVLERLTTASVDYHQSEGVGGTTSKVNQSITALTAGFADIAFTLVPAVAYLGLSLIAMLRMEWRLALLVLAFTPLPALIGAFAAREQTARERSLMDRWTRIYSRLNEVLAGIRTVKLFGMERAERNRFLDGQREGNEIVLKGVRTDARSGAARAFVVALARIAAIGFGGWLVLHGRLTIGALVAFLGYIGGLFTPVQGLTTSYQTMRKATVALETLYEIIDAEQDVEDLPGAAPARAVRGDVRFHNVTFAYKNGTPIVSDVDLHVRPGETVALVGPSGSGKTTLMNLLLRLHGLERGTILIDGQDIRAFTAESLRRQVAFVSQDIHLFNDTVAANVAYGRPGATRGEIEAAARSADAHDFIMTLPDGYDTMIGDRGGRLSGGQRQRIAIARALLKNAPVLVLDEATSALDAMSESVVQEALGRVRTGRTTLVIAHRLSTVVDADRIAVLKDGRVLAQGRHADLLLTCPYYASLVGASTNGLLHAA